MAAVPANACVSALVSTVAKYEITGPRPSPITRAVANSQPIANEPTRKRSPPNDDTISIPKPTNDMTRAVPIAMSRPIHVPSAANASATATRNMTWPSNRAAEIASGRAPSRYVAP